METLSDTIQKIRNTTCIVCGKGFSTPRAGKLYCSAKCKQFSFYHKEAIQELQNAKKGIDNSIIKLSLREFENYNSTIDKVYELKGLQKKQDSRYFSFEEWHQKRIEQLEMLLPEYLKRIETRKLSLESWSFFKILYPHLKNDEFYKLIGSFGEIVFDNLIKCDNKNKHQVNRLNLLFEKHLLKIGNGEIIFK